MAYVALYRAYRPRDFNDVAGQKVIVKTLQNAVIHDKIAHAYLFSGPRGTGKTSIAKIYAKAVNCLNPINGSPCNKCDVCKGIDKGDIADVIEIDAASNNGVDEIRELRDKVKYLPSVSKYKVYIIDEVHMLSTSAFNALLKTLEEPPKHIIFILATTEVHKIPATILSRCQRFDFKNIEISDIIEKLEEIVKKEKVSITKEAIHAIALNAEGGLRDAISLLDLTISFASDKITEKEVHQVSGSVSSQVLTDLLLTINNKEITQSMIILKNLLSEGKDINRIVNDLIIALRDVLLEKTTKVDNPKYQDLLTLPTQKIYYYIETLNAVLQDMKWTHQKQAYLELAFIKMMEHQNLKIIDYEAAITDLKAQIESLKENTVTKTVLVNAEKEKPLVTIKQVESILNNADKDKKELILKGWQHLKNYKKEHLKLTAYLLSQGTLEAVSDTMLITYDDIDTCKQMLESDIKKEVLEILNSKSELVKDYITILRSDWLIIKEIYLNLWNKGQRKPKLPAYDLKLYADNVKEQKNRPEIIDIAYDYFGDKVKIKE